MRKSREEISARAAAIWASLDDNEKHGIRFGLFPATKMRDIERDGFRLHDVTVALMDEAKRNGGMRA
jgi:hypothetical protein